MDQFVIPSEARNLVRPGKIPHFARNDKLIFLELSTTLVMSTAPPFQWSFLAPRYWPTWFGIGVLRLLCLLPLAWLLGLGSALGRCAGRVMPSRRAVVLTNLALCFPEKSEAEREALCDEHFAALGAGIFEAGLAWFASDARLRSLGRVEGLEHLDRVLAQGQGALLLTGHFTTLELGARFLVLEGRPFHAMYRPINNALIDYCMHRWREARSKLPALPKDDLKKLVRALRDGRCIWYAPDQSLAKRGTAEVPFFGVAVPTITATSRLAQLGRAAVVPYFPRRENGRYVVTIYPALENFPGVDEVQDATRVNQQIEFGVRAAPAQYFWVHRRFKHVNDRDVYAD